MKNIYRLRLLAMLTLAVLSSKSYSQCVTGYTQTSLNWDYLDYLLTTTDYTNNGYLSSNAMAYTQNFSFGSNNRLTIGATNTIGLAGNTNNHTGDVTVGGIAYTGNDIRYTINNVNETITLTFETEVANPSFTIYDIEYAQSLSIVASTTLGLGLPVAVTTQSGTILTVGILPTARTITASNVNSASTSNEGTATIAATGLVKTITIKATAVGSQKTEFYLSDITACVLNGNFPTNYYAVSKPFTNQPGYVLQAFDKSVYFVNPATGAANFLFTDAAGPGFINSLCYDPINRYIYYVYSLTVAGTPASVGNSKILKKYDVNTRTISTVLADINTIGVPTSSTTGLESGAAGFYNGNIYLGIETGNGAGVNTSNRKATIWRLDLTAGVPTRCSQVFALPIDDGSGTVLHDWSDFVINDGILYDFDGAAAASTTTQTDVYQFNLSTGVGTDYHQPSGWVPGQTAVDWNGKVYQLYGTTAIAPYIALYNNDGTIGTRNTITTIPALTSFPSVGDAGEAFRPLADFGDAPASYDPVAASPAVNEMSDTDLHVGANASNEWVTRGQTNNADADTYDDGIATVTIFSTLYSTYQVKVSVYNNTGANANLRGWLDYNGNGVFDGSETSASITVASSTSSQDVYLKWTSISSSLANGASTFLRVRMTSSAMTSTSATGWFPDGETEDYKVPVQNTVLPLSLISFDVHPIDNVAVLADWTISEEGVEYVEYELQHSKNDSDWETIYRSSATASPGTKTYNFADKNPYPNVCYYRLQIRRGNGTYIYSPIREIRCDVTKLAVKMFPNPAVSKTTLTISNPFATKDATISVRDFKGSQLYTRKVKLVPGENTMDIYLQNSWKAGTYLVIVETNETVINRELVLLK